MSLFGIFHTAISVLPIGLGAIAFWRDGRIDLKTHVGQAYLVTMLAGSVTALGFLFTRGFTPPQAFTLLTLAVLAVAVFGDRIRRLGSAAPYVTAISWSFSYFLLWFFTTTETLTRVPVGHPFASGPDAPELIPVRVALLAAFLVGVAVQVSRLSGRARLRVDGQPTA